MIDNLVKIKDYVPLFQTTLWIVFVSVLLIIFRKQISILISTIKDRINKGCSIKAGPFEIGEKLKDLEYVNQSSVKTGSNGSERENHRTKIYENNKGIFLTHIVVPSKKIPNFYDISIYLIRHKSNDFSDIDKAEFFFGHMWGNSVFSKKEKNGIIGISTTAYAPFLCTCCIKFKDGNEIDLNRYIDFEMVNTI